VTRSGATWQDQSVNKKDGPEGPSKVISGQRSLASYRGRRR